MRSDQEFLLKHARHPSHSGDLGTFVHRGSCKNPLCGDAVEVGVEIADGILKRVQIQASGCGISTASASLMSQLVEGKSLKFAQSALEIFNQTLLAKADSSWPDEIASLKVFSRLRESPTRVPCALIGWFALKDSLTSI